MIQAFLLSIRLHCLWFAEAFSHRGRQMVPLGWRRLGGLLVVFPLFVLLQLVHWFGFVLDEVFFRAYREVNVKEPLFITGIPRSGTTFIQRTLAKDVEQFTTMSTWEVVLAPSISGRKLVRGLAWIDRLIGRPGQRICEAVTRKLTGDLSDVHDVGLTSPEEDFLTLLPAGGCFMLILAFPSSGSLWQLGRFQEVPEDQRAILVNFYKACVKKHLYANGPERRFLSKNAAFGSWLPDLRFAFPDAHYLVCVREPKAVLSSQLSSIVGGLRFFSTFDAADTYSLEFQTVLAHAYRILLDEIKSFLVDHLAIIDQSELKENTRRILSDALRQIGIPLTPNLERALQEADQISRNFVSRHKHTPFKAKSGPVEFGSLVTQIYEQILEKPYLSRNERNR